MSGAALALRYLRISELTDHFLVKDHFGGLFGSKAGGLDRLGYRYLFGIDLWYLQGIESLRWPLHVFQHLLGLLFYLDRLGRLLTWIGLHFSVKSRERNQRWSTISLLFLTLLQNGFILQMIGAGVLNLGLLTNLGLFYLNLDWLLRFRMLSLITWGSAYRR